jgi:DNA-binding HxlR family transcriptional regulator
MRSSSSCRLSSILETIGDHWTLAIIHELSAGPRRTLDLFGAFTGLSTKTLAARLKMLNKAGLVGRVSYPETPPRVEYSLTEKGREVLPVLRALDLLARKWDAQEVEGDQACHACLMDEAAMPRALAAAAQADAEADPANDPAGQLSASLRARKRADVTIL